VAQTTERSWPVEPIRRQNPNLRVADLRGLGLAIGQAPFTSRGPQPQASDVLAAISEFDSGQLLAYTSKIRQSLEPFPE
jgi:hypothetical protein